MTDGNLLILIRRLIDLRGSNTVRVTKVKGHADEGLVAAGRVRELDRLGNNAADEAADFGRGRVVPAVIDARRNLSGVCGLWCPVMHDLHRFFIAISRAVVNHDGFGGTAPDPMVWSAVSMPERRRLVHAVRDLALLPGPPAIWLGEWVAGPCVTIGADDVAQWPCTLGLLVKWVSFLGSLHWPALDGDLGVGGISYVELLLLYELWAGERGALLAGSLPLRYCSSKFASRTPFKVLPVPGHVAGLITVQGQAAVVGRAEVARRVSGFSGKRFRLNRKTPAHLVGHYVHARPRVWRRLHFSGHLGDSDVDCKRRRYNQQDDDGSPVHPRTGVG